MAEPRSQKPVLLLVAGFSRHADALAWGRDHLIEHFGPVGLASPPFDFHHTEYYQASMGTNLYKQFFVFERLAAPDCLPDAKLFTNQLEQTLAATGTFPEERPLNLDPGILVLGKFLLATTKDQAHRIYLRDGIFAEVTLRFEAGAFEPWPWTYADYREPHVRAWLGVAREYYKQRLRSAAQ